MVRTTQTLPADASRTRATSVRLTTFAAQQIVEEISDGPLKLDYSEANQACWGPLKVTTVVRDETTIHTRGDVQSGPQP